MLVRKGQFLFTCKLAGCWFRRLHRGKLTSTWLTRKKKKSNFCFVFCPLNVLYHFFALCYHTQKNYVGVFLCHSFRMLFRNPLDETGLKKKKKQKQSLAPTMVTFPKFPWNFTACVTDQICACDTEEGAKEEYVSKISSRS